MYDNNKYDHYYYCDFLKSYGPNNVLAYLLLYYICMHILSICSYHHIHHREGKIGKITSRRVIICIILHIYMDYFILDINIHSQDCPGFFSCEKWSFKLIFGARNHPSDVMTPRSTGILLSHRPPFGFSPSASEALFVEKRCVALRAHWRRRGAPTR